MPVFGLSHKIGGSKKGGASSYRTAVDQLSIMENMLQGDGNLSPGDYDVLNQMARQIRNNPALTDGERSTVDVKISQYASDKSRNAIKDSSNIATMNKNIEDDNRANVMLYGNNPAAFTGLRVQSLGAKLKQITESYNVADQSGDAGGAAALMLEYNSTLDDYTDAQHAFKAVSSYNGEAKPNSDYVAYVTTNSKGEISDVKVGRFGSKSGYLRTNALYGGMQVFGKPNGENKFVLGGSTFRTKDIMLPDPANPLAGNYKVLVPENDQGAVDVSTGQYGTYVPLDPASLKPQQVVGVGEWAKGMNGTYYRGKDDGTYQKYVNVKDPTEIGGFDPSNVLPLPKNYEDLVNSRSTETINGASYFGPALPEGYDMSGISAPGPTTTPTQIPSGQQSYAPPAPTGTPRTPGPVSRAPSSALGYAGATIEKAKGFLGRLFG